MSAFCTKAIVTLSAAALCMSSNAAATPSQENQHTSNTQEFANSQAYRAALNDDNVGDGEMEILGAHRCNDSWWVDRPHPNPIPYSDRVMVDVPAKVNHRSSGDRLVTTKCIVNRGYSKHAVRAVQSALKSCYGERLRVDGSYGPKTKSAMKRAQRRHRLKADGIYGPKTSRKMLFPFHVPEVGYRVYCKTIP